jgi:hypothetical protein
MAKISSRVEFKLEEVAVKSSNVNRLIVKSWERTLKILSKKEMQRYEETLKKKN